MFLINVVLSSVVSYKRGSFELNSLVVYTCRTNEVRLYCSRVGLMWKILFVWYLIKFWWLKRSVSYVDPLADIYCGMYVFL